VLGDQGARLGEVSGRAGVTDGLIQVAGCSMPGRGPPMQGRDQLRVALVKL
jgi:hypothetical protein